MDLDKTIQIYMRDLLLAGATIEFKDLCLTIIYNENDETFDVIDEYNDVVVSYKKYISAENYVLSTQ